MFGVQIDQRLTPFLVGVISRRFRLLIERLQPTSCTSDPRALVTFKIVVAQYNLLMDSQEDRPRPTLPPALY